MSVEAGQQPTIARIVPLRSERAAGTLGPETVECASRRFDNDGALIIEDIVDISLVAKARRVFLEGYSRYLDGRKRDNVLMTGGRRLMITIDLQPPFNDPQLFANPYLLPMMEAALDGGFVIGAYVIVCSLSAAPAQRGHTDSGGPLFPSSRFDRLLPTSAITVGIPLLEMNNVHGTTALWLGSHREATHVSDEEGIEPVVREGSCILWDYRLWHGGTANRSAVPRPLLCITYCRPWFFDYRNFGGKKNPKQSPILMKRGFWSALSEQHQRLLARAASSDRQVASQMRARLRSMRIMRGIMALCLKCRQVVASKLPV